MTNTVPSSMHCMRHADCILSSCSSGADARLSCCMLSFRQALEDQDHAEGILLCVDCFHAVDALGTFKVTNPWPGPCTGCHPATWQLQLHGCEGQAPLLTSC